MTIRPSKPRIQITKEFIYDRVSILSVFEYYIPSIQIGKSIPSPLRKDRHPSFSIAEKDNGIVWSDWGTGQNGSCIHLVEKMFQLNYDKALQKIASDMGLIDIDGHDNRMPIVRNSDTVPATKKSSLIQCEGKKFTASELRDYWGRYRVIGLEKLQRYNVHSLKMVYVNREKIPIGKNEMVFGYLYGDKWKVLFPEREKARKWLSNIPLDTPEGLENLSKDHNALLVKSKKCLMVMEEVYPYLCAFQNESLGSVSEKTARYIIENSKEVFYGGDSDHMGKLASYKITSKFSWKHINVPDRILPKKDWSDWCELEDIPPIQKHLQIKGVIV